LRCSASACCSRFHTSSRFCMRPAYVCSNAPAQLAETCMKHITLAGQQLMVETWMHAASWASRQAGKCAALGKCSARRREAAGVPHAA
jgi:hypothetical protein